MNSKTTVGIDPGFKGALAMIYRGEIRVRDLPTKLRKSTGNEFDRGELLKALTTFCRCPGRDVHVGLEHPTTRPGEGAERSKRFGEGLGLIEGMLVALGVSYELIPPAKWKMSLGVPGKDWEGANEIGRALIEQMYPAYKHGDFHGPRGGLLDGRVDATLIAHYLSIATIGGMAELTETHGKGSLAAQALIFGKASGRRSMRLPKPER